MQTLTLNNGVRLPALGYRHVDTAAVDGLETGRRGGPEPEDITLAGFGRPIPES